MDERFIAWLSIYDEFAEGTALRDIFNDAIKCYRSGIARPALMLSYIAFAQAVRYNLLHSERPEGFEEHQWNKKMEGMRNEDKWDETVLQCIQKQSADGKPAFFDIPQNLRDDVGYWRNRRNDCAHYKDSEITLSHVSAFWSFLMDNYHKFTPLGGLQQSINEYLVHFDITKTPRGKSTEKIFQRLANVIKTADDIYRFLYDTSALMDVEDQCLVLHQLLHDDKHRQVVIEYLNAKIKRLLQYLRYYTTDVSLVLGNNKENARKLWHDDLTTNAYDAPIYFEMMRAGMIEGDEIKESLALLLDNDYKLNRCSVNKDEDFAMLNGKGIYDMFIDTYCTQSFLCKNPREKSYKTIFYIGYILKGGINAQLVSNLSEAWTSNFPYILRDRLKEVFAKDEYKQAYLSIIEREGIDDFLQLKAEEPHDEDKNNP